MIALFNRFEISMTFKQALSVSHQGRCDDDVKALVKVPKIKKQLDKLDPKDLYNELKGYGAWDELELSDTNDNFERIVWLAGCNIVEENKQKRE